MFSPSLPSYICYVVNVELTGSKHMTFLGIEFGINASSEFAKSSAKTKAFAIPLPKLSEPVSAFPVRVHEKVPNPLKEE